METISDPLLDLAAVRVDAVALAFPLLSGLGNAALSGPRADALAAVDAGRLALSMLAGCALRGNASIIASGIEFPGGAGLAPGWNAVALTRRERELVTGCLLAHLSASGLPQVVSMRGAPSLHPSRVERADWTIEDGRFFGDLLDDVQVMAACRGAGHLVQPPPAGLVDRICTEPDPIYPKITRCGLTNAGGCDDICAGSHCAVHGEQFAAIAAWVTP
ncbi:MAG TPA: hypothetical protein VLN57_21285 [Xanthobacteraceae bacterium]|nr:hypothetical protein [Xanthobacteraceae bacterium]